MRAMRDALGTMTDAKPEKTPGPYSYEERDDGWFVVLGPPGVATYDYRYAIDANLCVITANSAHAAGVASANERNEAQWARVIDRLRARLRVGMGEAGEAGMVWMLRIIDEERGK